ncbi:unnamed protein product [Phaedon cochleariae]|uniref:Carboxylic ester hydrolase n=1 Tax=Phaedon cochleariae TaxID=80249 RepID=A0A9P0GNF0_PHACE|nr:unnamed protein product [Phaedon cochleariae]
MLVVSLITFCFFQSVFAGTLPNVKIDDGLLSGIVLRTRNDREFSAFKGIPYARPPVGALRFQPPVPANQWQGTFNATEDHGACPQQDVFSRSYVYEGEEDCLYLNVYSPKLSDFEKDPLPVMVFIHGGGYMSGCGNSHWNDREFSAFKGIPYARPPVGALRFQPPVPANPWQGILNATADHVSCPQQDVFSRSYVYEGEEDCLYLNVYSPKLSDFEKDPLPVMVFIHGGGYMSGCGNSHWYGPDLLLDKDVVLVVLNYRLGALGFLSTGDEVAPGNNGMKDQVLALKWVQRNIAKFGGNPNSVTIFGESAGGASVHFHMMSPLSRGLFHGAIMESGTALCPWAFDQNSMGHTYSKQLAESLNCPTKSSADMLECLRKFDPKTIVEKSDIFNFWDYDPLLPFRPIVEPDSNGAFLTEHPLEIIKSGKLLDVPSVVGLTTEEGAIKSAGLKNANLLDEFCERFDEISPVSLFLDRVVKNPKPIISEIRKFYFGDKPLNKESLADIEKIFTDCWMLKGIDDAVRLHHKYNKQPVYYYLFGYRGSVSYSRVFGGGDEDYGVAHADELQYLFPVSDQLFPDIIPSASDKKIAKLMTTFWTNFARTRDPSPGVNDVIKQRWRPYSTEDGEYYFIHAESSGVRSDLYAERKKFWRKVLHDPLAEDSRDEL